MSAQLPKGARRTPQRERILRVLKNASGPMTAADIYRALEGGAAAISLSTVYRALDFFEAHDMITKTAVSGSDMAFYELRGAGHRHYAVCVRCNKLVPIENCPMHRFSPEISDPGFKVLGHRMELFGRCGECENEEE